MTAEDNLRRGPVDTTRRWSQFALGTASGALALIAVPALLVAAVGWPFPGALARTPFTARSALDMVALAAWVTWALCCLQLGRAIAERVRRRDITVDLASRLGDRLAARVAAAILVVSALTVTSQGAGAAPAAASRASNVSTSAPGSRTGRDLVTPGRRAKPGLADWSPLELSALGLGTVVASVLARRLRRRRQLRALVRPELPLEAVGAGAGPDESDAPGCDTATLVGHVEVTAAVDQIETVLRTFPDTFGDAGDERGGVRLLCSGPTGVDVVWGATAPPPLPPWILSEDGQRWHLPSDAPTPVTGRHVPTSPIVLPVGDDERGAWVAPRAAGSCLSVLGPAAEALVTAMRLVVEGWGWSDHVLVTDDPRVAAEEVRHATSPDVAAILFVGDPSHLDARTRASVAVVTTNATDAADLTLVVDRRAVTVHPLGLSLRPNLVDAGQANDLDALLSGQPSAARLRPSWARMADADHRTSRAPAVMVRLLTPMPRVEGLAEELPAKRARRAVELVAYLALHRPHPVTSDRLRTRVLGSADLDAAAKTLFNTVAAARRALGPDGSGAPLLPVAGRSGCYRLSDDVTVDVLEVEQLVRRAGREPEGTLRIEVLRHALSLVDGEPMAAASGGYAWWPSEGHAARVAGLLVDAACHLADLATAAGLPGLAAWGIAQARLVEPYSEALSRAAMRAAAGAGDGDRLRREWHECCRQVDELDPGGMPSAETEVLYGELVRRNTLPRVQASLPAIEPAPRSTVPSAPAAL